jgi:Domain of unknown function (DUF4258)
MLPQPWKSADATDAIRSMGRNASLTLSYTVHAKERLAERNLIVSDVLYVLKNGFVYQDPKPATQPALYKYEMENRTPNSNNRIVRIVVIPNPAQCGVKVITVMWSDE